MKLSHSLPGALSAIVLTLACTADRAHAAVTTFIENSYSTTASGTLNGVSFTNASIVIKGIYNPENIANVGGSLEHYLSADFAGCSVQISGLGTYAFLTTLRTFVHYGYLGLSRGGVDDYDLISFPSITAASTYNLDIPFSLTVTAAPIQWEQTQLLSSVQTTGGVLVLNNFGSLTTFTATAVPEASSLSFATLAGLAVLRRPTGLITEGTLRYSSVAKGWPFLST